MFFFMERQRGISAGARPSGFNNFYGGTKEQEGVAGG